MHLQPTQIVIKEFGSLRIAAEVTGLHLSRMYRWRRPREYDTGLVPANLQRRILNAAQRRGVKITCEDLVLGREIKVRRRRK